MSLCSFSRKLHNTIQELKGNVRVFCRVRPLLGDELSIQQAEKMKFPGEFLASIPYCTYVFIHELDPDGKKLALEGPAEANYAGKMKSKSYEFEFDKVRHCMFLSGC